MLSMLSMLYLLQIELQIKWSVFTLLICPSFCSSHLPAACLGALQTALKWFSLPHSPHVLPYAGHLLGGWMDPQYLHGLTGLIFLSVYTASNACVLMASSCLARRRTWSLLCMCYLLLSCGSSLKVYFIFYVNAV